MVNKFGLGGIYMGKKRVISVLMSMAMAVTMVPFLVSADTDPSTPGSFTELQQLIDSTSPANIALDKDYVALPGEGSLKITHGASIDLRGHTIDRNLSSAESDGHVFFVSGDPTDPDISGNSPNKYQLVITDSSADKTGKITGGYAENGGGIYCEYPAKISLMGVTITGNHATSKGGGIYLDKSVTYSTILGITLTNNTASYGGGLYTGSHSMEIKQYGTTTGTVISGNTAEYGGGIYNAGFIKFYEAVSITGNSATVHGGGIYQHDETENNFGGIEVRESLIIKDNTGDNVYLCSGEKISIGGNFNDDARIGVNTEDPVPVVVTSGFYLYAHYHDATKIFFSDQQGARVNTDKDTSSPTNNEVILEPVSLGFKGCSVTLDGRIGLNVYVDMSALTEEQRASAKMKFEIPGKGGNTQYDTFDPAFTASVDGVPCYGFTCYLSSIQMAEDVTTTLTYTGGSLSSDKTFSLKNYLASFYSTPVVASPNGAYNLVPFFAGYGYYVQQYLSGLRGWSIGTDYAEMPNSYGLTFEDDRIEEIRSKCSAYASSKSVGDSVESVKYKLGLDTTTVIEVTIKLKSEAKDQLSASCTYAGKSYTAYRSGTREYKIRIEGIYLQDLDKKITISGTSGDGEALTVTVSALGYVNAALNNPNSNTAKKKAMCALYEVWEKSSFIPSNSQQN